MVLMGLVRVVCRAGCQVSIVTLAMPLSWHFRQPEQSQTYLETWDALFAG